MGMGELPLSVAEVRWDEAVGKRWWISNPKVRTRRTINFCILVVKTDEHWMIPCERHSPVSGSKSVERNRYDVQDKVVDILS